MVVLQVMQEKHECRFEKSKFYMYMTDIELNQEIFIVIAWYGFYIL